MNSNVNGGREMERERERDINDQAQCLFEPLS